MPKRSAEEKIEWHTKRLKRLKEQQQKGRRRVIIYSSDSDEKSGKFSGFSC
jgi:Iap family predicted aminopeptidase